MNLLEQEAERLKQVCGPAYHKTIEHNLKRVSEQMAAAPSSISVEEGLIALATWDLPPLTREGRPKRARRAAPPSNTGGSADKALIPRPGAQDRGDFAG